MIRRSAFFGIVWAYVWLVAQYAIATPPWQIPDEPAHYNYVRFVAEQAAIPVLNSGDYDQAYLEAIKAQKFPEAMSIDTIRYESHQPPLYYLAMTPFYLAGKAAPLAERLIGLRLASALLGVVLLAITYRLSREVLPDGNGLPVLATAFVAFVPQHLAMLAGVENDVLAELLLAGVALCLIRVLRFAAEGAKAERRNWWAVGLLVGLGLVTKTTTYVSAGLVAVTILLLWRQVRDVRRSLSYAIPALILALGIGAVWFVRNAAVYGPLDWLGLARHNAVVFGQPRTLDLYGSYLVAATYYFPIMFRSFWGQFGWMGVPLDSRTYTVLLAFTVLLIFGLAVFLYRLRREPAGAARSAKSARLSLLGAWVAFTFVATVGYSLEFFQAQGRYLFPALGAIAFYLALGLCEWLALAQLAALRMHILPFGIERPLAVVCVAGLATFALFCLQRYLVPGLHSLSHKLTPSFLAHFTMRSIRVFTWQPCAKARGATGCARCLIRWNHNRPHYSIRFTYFLATLSRLLSCPFMWRECWRASSCARELGYLPVRYWSISVNFGSPCFSRY
jgi:4-amino-4-deoxy-L-arabinose transferase-like glycosyltransferase